MEPDKEKKETWPPDHDEGEEEDEDDTGTGDLPGTSKKLSLSDIRNMSVEELRPYFKDVRGCWRTANLFEETCEDPAKYPPIYSLKDEDTSSCVSLKRLYLLIEDVTEHKFAEMCLGSWDHWELIQKSWVLKPHIERWRELLDLQLRSKYLGSLKALADTGDGASALNATKYLLETTTSFGKEKSRRGRPSKAEKEAALQRETKSSEDIKHDAERLGLKVV